MAIDLVQSDIAPPAGSVRAVVRRYLGDLVYGANDGIITTFAIVAGVAGAELSAGIVLILGVANLVADGFSMAASNYLSIRSGAAVERQDTQAARPRAVRHGAATFLAFIIAGSVPLAAYLGPENGIDRFAVATVLTLATLFTVGALRTVITRGSWLRNGGEMLFIGALAAAVAYWIGHLLAPLVDGARV